MRQQATKPNLFRFFRATVLWLVLLSTAFLLCTGCAPQIGDACEFNDDCPDAAVCHQSTQDGICTIVDCRQGDCPSESVCVEFSRHETFCLRSCQEDEDCREDHSCIDDQDLDKTYCFVDD